MAARADIKTTISLDRTQLEAGLRSAGNTAIKFGKIIAGIGIAGFAAGVVTAGYALIRFSRATKDGIIHAADLAGRLSDVSANLGIVMGDVAVMERAFQNAGLAGEKFQMMVVKLNMALEDARRNPGGTSAGIFSQLGLDPQQLGGSSGLNRVMSVLNELRKMQDAQRRAAFGQSLFGRGGGGLGALISDPAAFSGALKQIGPDFRRVLNESGGALDDFSDKLQQLNPNTTGSPFNEFFTGAGSKIAGEMNMILTTISEHDFTPLGERFGEGLETGLEILVGAFANGGKATEAMKAGIILAFRGAVDAGYETIRDAIGSIANQSVGGILLGRGGPMPGIINTINRATGIDLPGGGAPAQTNEQLRSTVRNNISDLQLEGRALFNSRDDFVRAMTEAFSNAQNN